MTCRVGAGHDKRTSIRTGAGRQSRRQNSTSMQVMTRHRGRHDRYEYHVGLEQVMTRVQTYAQGQAWTI